MAKKSFLKCPHKRIQQYTEHCLDCGYSIYMTEEQYLKQLRQEAGTSEQRKEIYELEKKLGIE